MPLEDSRDSIFYVKGNGDDASNSSIASNASSDYNCRVPNEELKQKRNRCANDNDKLLKALTASRTGTRAANNSSRRSRSRSR